MKKLLGFLFALLAVFVINGSFSNVAEASMRVAVVPLQVDENQVERAGDLTNYYWDIIVDRFQYPDYELLDDDKLLEIVPAEGLAMYDQATLTDIAEKADADIVVAMRIDKVDENPINSRREPTLECFMKGQMIGYNRVTGKFYNKKINEKFEIEEVLTYRNDWQQETFADYLRRGINRTLEDKKKK